MRVEELSVLLRVQGKKWGKVRKDTLILNLSVWKDCKDVESIICVCVSVCVCVRACVCVCD